MEWNAPFAGGRIPGYTKGICTTYIGDDGVNVGEGDIVAGCDNVVYTYEGSAESIGDDSCLIDVPGGARRMLCSQGVPSNSRRGDVVIIMAPLSTTALGPSGEVWTSSTSV